MSNLAKWQIGGFVFTSAFGTLLHFLYDISGKSIILAPFSAVNESTWEHMKILFVPMFIYALIENKFIGTRYPDLFSAKLIGILMGLILIPVLFYSYTGIFGKSVDFINISIFFIVAAIVYYIENLLIKNRATFGLNPKIALIIICLIFLVFAVTTFIQPDIPLFIDSATGKSGIG
ncbi:MAG: hypothetical protein IJN15_03415 [Clostridia bacterium]|nr:hypothetical protein [Clostridia bacterium]